MPDLGARIHAALRDLSPGYFAMVMATGILSVGARSEGRLTTSRALLVVALVAFVALVALNAWRLVAFPQALERDFADPQRGFGFYTLVAAADVLAARLTATHRSVAAGLVVGAATCWLVRSYALPWTTRLTPQEHPIVAAANGSWFMWSVGVQSVAVAAVGLALAEPSEGWALLAVAAWALGLFLYALDGVLVVVRLMTLPVTPADLRPPYWISMGAAAIAALAAARIAELPAGAFAEVAQRLAGTVALLAWVVASWLIPALCGMGWWRHVTHRVRFGYHADLWSIVFPLGMYAVATSTLARAEALPWLDTVGSLALGVALAAWLAVAALGLRHVLVDVLLRTPRA